MTYFDVRSSDYSERDLHYRQYISNLAYTFKFDVIYESNPNRIFKVENGETKLIVSEDDGPWNNICWRGWRKLAAICGWDGFGKYGDDSHIRLAKDRAKREADLTPFADYWNQLCEKQNGQAETAISSQQV